MLKLKACLILFLLTTVTPVQQVEAWTCCLPDPTCWSKCWRQNQFCEHDAETDYQICIKNEEEAACRFVYRLEMGICATQYNRCWDRC